MGVCMQKKDLDKGSNLVYVATILIGGNINDIGFTFLQWEWSKTFVTLAILYFFLVHVKYLRPKTCKKEIQCNQYDKYFGLFQL